MNYKHKGLGPEAVREYCNAQRLYRATFRLDGVKCERDRLYATSEQEAKQKIRMYYPNQKVSHVKVFIRID